MKYTREPDGALLAKSDHLSEGLAACASLLVAYSGGTDSAFLAWAAHQTLGDRMLAVIADSASLPRAELAAALAFAQTHGIPVETVATGELDNADYQRNDAQRCFHCKDELFTRMENLRDRRGFAHIAYGMNLDDRGDFRPGQRAAAMHHALAPLVDAQLTKAEIRELAHAAGLSLADKPASACLSSRIEYGRPVTAAALAQVEQAEAALHAMGFRQLRVRHHGELARIELDRAELPRALALDVFARMSAEVKAAGFRLVTLDLDGFRSGSMNALLPVAQLTAPR